MTYRLITACLAVFILVACDTPAPSGSNATTGASPSGFEGQSRSYQRASRPRYGVR